MGRKTKKKKGEKNNPTRGPFLLTFLFGGVGDTQAVKKNRTNTLV
jgi:hypothetical protein